MYRLSAAALLLALSFGASASCVGTANFATCTDASGNSYTVNRMGNTTMMQGYNPNTGSSWNQNSTTMGNTTFHNGTAANGNSWSGTSQQLGNTTYHNGIDSRGNSYNKVCNQYGCN